MRIAVIGDYESPEKYKNLRMQVALLYQDDYILDLSRHNGTFIEMRDARWADIDSSHLVVISGDWMDQKIDIRKDIHQAQELGKEILIFQNGRLNSYQQNAYRG